MLPLMKSEGTSKELPLCWGPNDLNSHLRSHAKQSFMKGDFDEIVNNLWDGRKGGRSSYVP